MKFQVFILAFLVYGSVHAQEFKPTYSPEYQKSAHSSETNSQLRNKNSSNYLVLKNALNPLAQYNLSGSTAYTNENLISANTEAKKGKYAFSKRILLKTWYNAKGERKVGVEHTFSNNRFVEISLNNDYDGGDLLDLFDVNSGLRF